MADAIMSPDQEEAWALEQLTVNQPVPFSTLKEQFRAAGHPAAVTALRRLELRRKVQFSAGILENGEKWHNVTRLV